VEIIVVADVVAVDVVAVEVEAVLHRMIATVRLASGKPFFHFLNQRRGTHGY
jgi:hypothetical protein